MTHHEFVSINTAIPKQLLSSIEIEALQSFGLVFLDEGSHYAISSGESVDNYATLKVDDPYAMLERIAHGYIGEQKPGWLERIEESLLYLVDDPFADSASFVLPGLGASILSILQGCLAKRVNSGCHEIKGIYVEGSYFAEHSETSSTDGWAAIVRIQGTKFVTSRTMIKQFRQDSLREQQPERLQPDSETSPICWQLANTNGAVRIEPVSAAEQEQPTSILGHEGQPMADLVNQVVDVCWLAEEELAST